eukprot:gene14510-biopygen11614
MAEDYVRHDQLQDPNATFQQQHIHMLLADIQKNLHIHAKSLQDFPEMPQPPADYAQPQQPADINIEQEGEQGQQILEQLNPEEVQVHNAVVHAIKAQSTDNYFFLEGPAGNGVEPHDHQDQINLPQQICINSLDLINSIYPQAESGDAHLLLDPNTMSERCSLTPKNEFSHHINELILQRLPTPRKQYLSIDTVQTDDPEEAAAYPMEFLNAQTPGGMPLHSLQLKVGTTIILLRNIEPAKGLCNGTRLIVRDLKQHIITAEIITTQNKGQYVMLPRITMTCQDSSLPISMARKQFQVRLAYCLTNNKAQGPSLTHVGIYLPEPVFAHGQLYVAISRAKSFSGLKAKDLMSSYSSGKDLMSSYSSGKRPGVFIQLGQRSDVFTQLRQRPDVFIQLRQRPDVFIQLRQRPDVLIQLK